MTIPPVKEKPHAPLCLCEKHFADTYLKLAKRWAKEEKEKPVCRPENYRFVVPLDYE